MSLFFTIQITGGTSPGPYTIYYNTVSSGSVATIFETGLPATGKTLSQLTTGINVIIPDTASQIILYNSKNCNLYQTFQIPTQPKEYPKLCFQISDDKGVNTYLLEYMGVDVGGKPQYTDGNIAIQWNSVQNYWEMIGYPNPPETIISTTISDIPDTNWVSIGGPNFYIILVNQGECPNLFGKNNGLTLYDDNPTCVGDTDGSIHATVNGIGSTWVYSLDGLVYSNPTGIFTGLGAGQYTIYAKDLSGNVLSDTVTLTSDPLTYFNIPYTKEVQNLNPIGNMKYYNLKIIYNTSLIPLGESLTFDFRFVYNLLYSQPGTVVFDTSNSSILINNIPQPINQTNTTPFLVSSPLPCDPNNYYQLISNEEYSVPSLTLMNGDTFEVNIVYGIDTQSAGAIINNCITQGSVNINTYFENTSTTCVCCRFTGNQINNIGIPQIYIF